MPTPVFTSPAAVNVDETHVAALTVVATDAATYAITGGADAALFSIDPATGELSFNSAPDFEAPGDTGGDNTYEIEITADDGTGLITTQTLTISVNDVQEGPPVLDGGSVKMFSVTEGETAVGTFIATDPDTAQTLTYSIGGPIGGGDDAALFSLDPTTGELSFASAPDFDSPSDVGGDNIYNVNITVSDGQGGSDTQAAIITVTKGAVNSAPVITSNAGADYPSIFIAEGATAVTTVQATDADSEFITYSIVGGDDSAAFSIDASTGELLFRAAPNPESPTDANGDGGYIVIVQATDSDGGFDTQTIFARCEPTREVFVAEHTLDASNIAALGPGARYSIAGGADAARFTVNPTGAEAYVSFVSAPDYESANDADADGVYEYVLRATDDSGNVRDFGYRITITDQPEPPVITSNGGGDSAAWSIEENQTTATTVVAMDVDAGATITYSITGGADAALFAIGAGTGELSFRSAPDFEHPIDADGNNVYEVEIAAGDGVGGVDTQTMAITVTDLDETPTNTSPEITSNGGGAAALVSVDEGALAVTTVQAVDVDNDSIAYTIAGGTDAAAFAIDAATGELTLNAEPDFETKSSYEVEVQAADGNGGTDTQLIFVSIRDVDEAAPNRMPSITSSAAITVAENTETTTAIATLAATDADSDPLTWFIAGGDDARQFYLSIDGSLHFSSVPDFESPRDSNGDNTYALSVCVIDGAGGAATQSITIHVTDESENTAPVMLAQASYAHEQGRSVVDQLVAYDADGDELTYSITGGADASVFEVTPEGRLSFEDLGGDPAGPFVRSADGDYTFALTVAATDPQGLTVEQAITITTYDPGVTLPTIQSYYIAYYGRWADPAGAEYWQSQFNADAISTDALIDAFGNSDEYRETYSNYLDPNGAVNDARGMVTKAYWNMFGRTPDPAGLDFYVSAIESQRSSFAKVAIDMLVGARNDDHTLIHNRIGLAQYATDMIDLYGLEFSMSEAPFANRLIASIDDRDASVDEAMSAFDIEYSSAIEASVEAIGVAAAEYIV